MPEGWRDSLDSVLKGLLGLQAECRWILRAHGFVVFASFCVQAISVFMVFGQGCFLLERRQKRSAWHHVTHGPQLSSKGLDRQ